jgi:hypothetical protein
VVNAAAFVLNGTVRHFPILGVQETRDGLESRALACTVGSKKGDDASSWNLDGHPFEDQDDLMVLDLDVVDPEDFFYGFQWLNLLKLGFEPT